MATGKRYLDHGSIKLNQSIEKDVIWGYVVGVLDQLGLEVDADSSQGIIRCRAGDAHMQTAILPEGDGPDDDRYFLNIIGLARGNKEVSFRLSEPPKNYLFRTLKKTLIDSLRSRKALYSGKINAIDATLGKLRTAEYNHE